MKFLVLLGFLLIQFSVHADLMPSGSLNCKRTDKNPLKCLACSIYFEARGESLQSQVDVAQTMITRVLDDYFPDTMCKVVWQASQFSWTRDGKDDYIPNGPVLRRVIKAANIAINSGPNGLDHYYAQKIVNPAWARKSSKCRKTKVRKGDHTFCNMYYKQDVWRSGLLARDILMNMELKDIPIPMPAPRDSLDEELTVEEIILEAEAEQGLPEGLKEYPNESM